LVVITPRLGISAINRWIIGIAVVTMPDGMVKAPERDLPRKSKILS
jgi:hypothetical protein